MDSVPRSRGQHRARILLLTLSNTLTELVRLDEFPDQADGLLAYRDGLDRLRERHEADNRAYRRANLPAADIDLEPAPTAVRDFPSFLLTEYQAMPDARDLPGEEF